MQALSRMVLAGSCLLLTGCHCCGLSEQYSDHIDDVSDHKVCLDRWYCERLDLTRLCLKSRCCR